MHRILGRLAQSFVLLLFALGSGCSGEHHLTAPTGGTREDFNVAGPVDTGSALREKWIARLDARELVDAGPHRWFSMRPTDLQLLRSTRASVVAPFAPSSPVPTGAVRRSIDDEEFCWGVCLSGATSPSIAAGNIMVATFSTYPAFRLEYAGGYNVQINRKALGGGTYFDMAFRVAAFGSTSSMNISALPTDTVDVFATSTHNGELFESRGITLKTATSFGHDAVTPPLPPLSPKEWESGGMGGPDDGVWCLLHYRSWDGGRTWYFMWADNCSGGKYKGALAMGGLSSASVSPVGSQLQAGVESRVVRDTASETRAGSGTFVVLGQDKLANDQRAVVYVRPGLSPEAVIAVDRVRVKPVDLADALAALLRFQGDSGSREAGSIHRLAVMQRTRGGALTPAARSRLGGYLAALKNAPRINVPGVGDGHAVEVWLPDRR
jgi:hypothetical protein